jgi:hypothetical protein
MRRLIAETNTPAAIRAVECIPTDHAFPIDGADCVLAKPVDANELLLAVKHVAA